LRWSKFLTVDEGFHDLRADAFGRGSHPVWFYNERKEVQATVSGLRIAGRDFPSKQITGFLIIPKTNHQGEPT
jgi:hypothetical protein